MLAATVPLQKTMGEGDEMHMNFHFPLMPRIFMALARADRTPIKEIMARTPDLPEGCQWGTFLRCHDELTLEMVTEEERHMMLRAYARDDEMRINLGIRRRLAPLLDNDRRKIELLNAVLFSLPGTPVVYYGDEIGMGDNIYLGDRDGVSWRMNPDTGIAERHPMAMQTPQQPEACGRCHARRGIITSDYEYGRMLADTHRVALLTAWTDFDGDDRELRSKGR